MIIWSAFAFYPNKFLWNLRDMASFCDFPLQLHVEKEDLKVDASIQVEPLYLTARWDVFYWDSTERQTGSVWAAGEEKEAPKQWESGDLLSHGWGPLISHQSLSTTETWLQWDLVAWLWQREVFSQRKYSFLFWLNILNGLLRQRLRKISVASCGY